jgi:hypothetical protein
MPKTKKLPSFITAELRRAEWNEVGRGAFEGYVWRKDGVELHIVPGSLNKMYHVTYTKMSEGWTKFLHEPVVLELITKGE